MTDNVYQSPYQKIKQLILAKAKEYYKNNRDRLSKQARERYCNLSEEKKTEKLKYDKNRRRNMTEEDKIKRRAYIRNWYYNLPEVVKNKKREHGRNRYHTMIKAC